MKFEELLQIVGDEPVFDSGLLLAGDINEKDVRKQLSRWTRSGKLIQIRRGLYALAPPHQKVRPHPFTVANLLMRGSYVSCESALAHYGMIPEYVPVTVSVSVSRPGRWVTSLGVYQFHHIRPSMHFGYGQVSCEPGGAEAMVAFPEKALLDLIYLRNQGDRVEFIRSLRLQNLNQIKEEKLIAFAEKSKSKKLIRSVQTVLDLVYEEKREYQPL